MNPFEMVIAIVAIGTVGKVLQAKYGVSREWRFRGRNRGERQDRWQNFMRTDNDLAAENGQLRDEMKGLKERIQVLERLATDDESDARRLDREIEKLRDARTSGKDLTRE